MNRKKSYSELRESIRNDVCRNYTRRIESLHGRIDALLDLVKVAEKERDEAREKLRDVENENNILRDWIERLCDYCNMTEADRQLTFEALRKDAQNYSIEKIERCIYDTPLFKYLNVLQ